ncbi:MAG: TolC family protein [Halanaerobiales bacterium]|nr:TolC family protein [Halanaerobiales bacterium]
MIGKIKLSCIIVIACILLGTMSGLAVEELKLTLNDTIELAEQKSPELMVISLSLENAKLDYQERKLTNLTSESRLERLSNELALAQAEKSSRQNKNKYIIELTRTYLNLVQSEAELVFREKEVDFAKMKLENIKVKYESGHVENIQFLQQTIEYNTSLGTLKSLIGRIDQQSLELVNKIGLERGVKIQVSSIDFSAYKITLEEVIEKTLNNNHILDLKEQQITLFEEQLRLAEISNKSKIDVKKLANNLAILKLEYELEKAALINDTQKQYYNFVQSFDQLQLSKELVHITEEHYRITQEQVMAGLLTNTDLSQVNLNLEKYIYDYQIALNNYELSILKLQQVMGFALGVSSL